MLHIRKEHLKGALSNPMLLLIVGAIISSIIIPYYTRQWQDHQKELELKTNLSDEINKAVSDILVSADYKISAPSNDTVAILKNWDIAKAMISSKIKAYFSDIHIAQNWDNLSSAASGLYHIVYYLPPKNNTYYDYYFCGRLGPLGKMYESYPQSGPMNVASTEISLHKCNRYSYVGIENMEAVEKYFPTSNKSVPVRNDTVDWNALLHIDNSAKDFNRSFDILEKHIQAHTQKLLDVIFRSPITVFR
jgi:hypothetical protein